VTRVAGDAARTGRGDPKIYTRPWTVKQSMRLRPEDELIEHICEENNKASPQVYTGQ
jgi:hypothetical protein